MEQTNTFRIPIIIRGNSPFAKICINGNELTFLVDSGAGVSVYDKKYINCLGINEDQLGDAITDISGIGENSFDGRLVMIFFNIDDTKFANQFTVSELGNTFRAFKDSLGDVAGVIGGDFLFNYAAIIDYGAQEMRIEKERIDSILHEIMAHVKQQ